MNYIFSFFAFILFIYVYFKDIFIAFKTKDPGLKKTILRSTGIVFLLALSSMFIVNYLIGENGKSNSDMLYLIFSIALSLLISLVWIHYVRSLDIYEPERKKYLVITFVLACVSIWLAFPLTGLINSTGFTLNGDGWNDFLYCFIGIGGVEEFVKIIPVFIMLKFFSQINEPIDYIVYGTLSALGFAFIENIMYLQSTNLYALSARLLYSSVAHMFFTSVICYGLAIDLIKKRKHHPLRMLLYFIIAALSHGFYDFWLINEAFFNPMITTLFFIVTLHIWVTLKNNLINHSNFYSKNVVLKRNKIKYRLIVNLVFVIYIGYIAVAYMDGSESANKLLTTSFYNYLFLIVYVAISFSSYNIIPGYLAPITTPSFVYLPRAEAYPNYEDLSIRLTFGRSRFRKVKTPDMYGSLVKRVVVDDDFNWYLFEQKNGLSQYLLKPLDFDSFSKKGPKKVKVCKVKSFLTLDSVTVSAKEMTSCKLSLAYLYD